MKVNLLISWIIVFLCSCAATNNLVPQKAINFRLESGGLEEQRTEKALARVLTKHRLEEFYFCNQVAIAQEKPVRGGKPEIWIKTGTEAQPHAVLREFLRGQLEFFYSNNPEKLDRAISVTKNIVKKVPVGEPQSASTEWESYKMMLVESNLLELLQRELGEKEGLEAVKTERFNELRQLVLKQRDELKEVLQNQALLL